MARQITRRNEDEKEHDRTLAMMLHLQDFTLKEIASIIKKETGRAISYSQVRYDIQHVRDEWKEARLKSFEEHINEELMRLDSVERELWKSWRKSNSTLKTKRVEEVLREAFDEHGEEVNAEMVVAKITTTTKDSPGDVKYLDLIIKTQQERRKLLGLYAPLKMDIHQEHSIKIKGYAGGVSPDDWPEHKFENPNTVEGEVV